MITCFFDERKRYLKILTTPPGVLKSKEIQKRSDGFNMMVKDVQHGKTIRKSFARIEEILEMPNLIEIQKKSYEWFLDTGLREVFEDVSAITDYTGNLELTFLDYALDDPKYSIEECKARDATFACPLKVRVRLRNKETGEIKEQEIFMGEFPRMTQSGTFIFNGAERASVSPGALLAGRC